MNARTRLALEKAARLDRLGPALEEALRTLDARALPLDALWSLGELCWSADDLGRAREYWEEILRREPGHVRASNGLGALAYRRGELEAAERHLLAACRAGGPAKERKAALANLTRLYNRTPLLRERWLARRRPTPADLERMAEAQRGWRRRPKVSILMPHFNQRPEWLEQAIESVLAQLWGDWELCVADDASTDPRARAVLERYAALDPRVRVRWLERNVHIAGATNRALEIATGDWIAFLDSDDVLLPHALHACVRHVQDDPQPEFLYSDNATIDAEGKLTGLMLKPAWSPEFFLSTNYVVHFCMYSRDLVERVGPFNEDERHKGVQDVDIKARLLDLTDRVTFVPEVLYLWREAEGSVSSGSRAKPYVLENARRVFEEVLERRGIDARVEFPALAERLGTGIYKIAFAPRSDRRVTLVVPAERASDVHPGLLRAARENPAARIEVLMIVPPGGAVPVEGARVVECAGDAELDATLAALDCDYLLFCDPKAEPVGTGWLAELRGYLDLHPRIGIAGGKILDAKNRVSRGAWLLLDEPTVANKGAGNESYGYWFNNVIAHNVSAVDQGFLIARRELLARIGGLRRQRFGPLAGIDLCLRAREAGYRVVYDPWAEALVRKDRALPAPDACVQALREAWPGRLGRDPYYNPGFSQREQYKYDEVLELGLPVDVEDDAVRRVAKRPEGDAPPVVAAAPTPAIAARRPPADAPRAAGGKKLRINFVLPPAPKITGGPLAILEYANRLAARGHRVTVTTYPDLYWNGPSPFPWFDFEGRLLYKELRPALRGDLPAPPGGTVRDEEAFFQAILGRLLKAGGLPVLDGFLMSIGCDPRIKAEAGLNHLLHLWLRAAWLIEVMPDCDLNIATFWETAFPVYWSRKGRPVYFMQHFEEVFYPNAFPYLATKLAVRASYGLPMHKVANSSWLRGVLLERFGQDVPWSNNGIELGDFHPREKDSARDGTLRVVTYSRPEEWKGFCDAAEAMRIVRERHAGRVEWHVFGYRNPNVDPQDEQAGYLYHEGLSFRELADLYARCDVALCPSWYESFPLPPLEAMASGTAVVTTGPGTEDYAFDGRTALVVQPRRVEEMAQAVLRLLEDAALRQRLAAAGRAESERFDWDRAVERREAILLDIHEGRTRYDRFRASKAGLHDGDGIEFERAPLDLGIEDGRLVRAAGGVLPAVYLLDQGCKRYLIEGSSLAGTPFEGRPLVELDPLALARIPMGSPIYGPHDLPGPIEDAVLAAGRASR